MDLTGLEIRDDGGGCRLRVRVRPGGRADEVLGAHGGALRLSVTARPEKGLANRAVAALLARIAGLPARAVTITSGLASRDKGVRVEGLSAAELRARLNAEAGRSP